MYQFYHFWDPLMISGEMVAHFLTHRWIISPPHQLGLNMIFSSRMLFCQILWHLSPYFRIDFLRWSNHRCRIANKNSFIHFVFSFSRLAFEEPPILLIMDLGNQILLSKLFFCWFLDFLTKHCKCLKALWRNRSCKTIKLCIVIWVLHS